MYKKFCRFKIYSSTITKLLFLIIVVVYFNYDTTFENFYFSYFKKIGNVPQYGYVEDTPYSVKEYRSLQYKIIVPPDENKYPNSWGVLYNDEYIQIPNVSTFEKDQNTDFLTAVKTEFEENPDIVLDDLIFYDETSSPILKAIKDNEIFPKRFQFLQATYPQMSRHKHIYLTHVVYPNGIGLDFLVYDPHVPDRIYVIDDVVLKYDNQEIDYLNKRWIENLGSKNRWETNKTYDEFFSQLDEYELNTLINNSLNNYDNALWSFRPLRFEELSNYKNDFLEDSWFGITIEYPEIYNLDISNGTKEPLTSPPHSTLSLKDENNEILFMKKDLITYDPLVFIKLMKDQNRAGFYDLDRIISEKLGPGYGLRGTFELKKTTPSDIEYIENSDEYVIFELIHSNKEPSSRVFFLWLEEYDGRVYTLFYDLDDEKYYDDITIKLIDDVDRYSYIDVKPLDNEPREVRELDVYTMTSAGEIIQVGLQTYERNGKKYYNSFDIALDNANVSKKFKDLLLVNSSAIEIGPESYILPDSIVFQGDSYTLLGYSEFLMGPLHRTMEKITVVKNAYHHKRYLEYKPLGSKWFWTDQISPVCVVENGGREVPDTLYVLVQYHGNYKNAPILSNYAKFDLEKEGTSYIYGNIEDYRYDDKPPCIGDLVT